MPKIIGQAEQQRAMREIRAGLKELESINRFLNSYSKDSHFTITFVSSSNEKITAVGFNENKAEVDLLIMNQRDRIIREITNLAKSHRIEFDEQDHMILENICESTEEAFSPSDTEVFEG